MLKFWRVLVKIGSSGSGVIRKHERLFVYASLFAISILAFGLRLWNCDKYPPLASDMASDYLVSLHIIKGIEYPVAQGFVFSPIMSYIRAFFIYVFGVNTFSAILPAVIFGTLAIIVIFFLTKEMYDQKVALLACLLMSINPIAIWISHVSRFEDPILFLSVLAIYFFYVAVEKGGKKWLLCFAGFIMGLALQSHPVSLVVIPDMFIYLIMTKKLAKWLKDKYFWLAIIFFLLAYSNIIYANLENGMPLSRYWPYKLAYPVLLKENLNTQLILDNYGLYFNTLTSGMVLLNEPFQAVLFYGWDGALINFLKLVNIAVFLLGLVLSLIKREKGDVLMLTMLTLPMILYPLLFLHAPYYYLSALLPVLAVLPARLIKEILLHSKMIFSKARMGKLAPRCASKLATAFLLLITIFLYVAHPLFLLNDAYNEYQLKGYSTADFVEVVDFIKDSAASTSIIVVPIDLPVDLISFLTNDQIQPLISNIYSNESFFELKTIPDLINFEMKYRIRDIYYIFYSHMDQEVLLRRVHPGIEPVYTIDNSMGETLYSIYKVGGNNATSSSYLDQPEIYFDLFRAFTRLGFKEAGLSELPKGYVGYNRYIALDAVVNEEGFVEYYETYFWNWGFWPSINWPMNESRITITSEEQNTTYVLDSTSFPKQKVYLWNLSSNSFEEWDSEGGFSLQNTTKIRILRYGPQNPLVVSTTFTIEPDKPRVISQIEIFNNDTEATYDIAFNMSISAYDYGHICSRGLFSQENATRIYIPDAYAFTEPLWSTGARAFFPAMANTSYIVFGAYRSDDVISFACFNETPDRISVSVSSQGEVQQSDIAFQWTSVGPQSSVALTIILGSFTGDSTLDQDNDGVLDFLNTISELKTP